MDRNSNWQFRRQSKVEQIAAKDKTFADNFRALVFGGTQDPVRANVERWLIRAHYRRQEVAERRDEREMLRIERDWVRR